MPTTTLAISHMWWVYQGCRLGMGVPGLPWHPQILSGQLTLSQPGRTNCAPTLLRTDTPGFSNPLTALCTEEEQKFNGYVYGYVKILEEDSTRLVAALSLLSLMSSQLCSQTKIIIFKFWRAKLFSVILKLIFWKFPIFSQNCQMVDLYGPIIITKNKIEIIKLVLRAY